MLEFILCFPFIATILLCIFFLGHVMRNQQRMITSDRYIAWRTAHNQQANIDGSNHAYYEYGEPDETAERAAFLSQYKQTNYVDLSGYNLTTVLKPRFFTDTEIKNLSDNIWGGPDTTLQEIAEQAEARHPDAGTLAQRAIQYWPRGIACRLNATFPSENYFVAKLENISRNHQSDIENNSTELISRRHARDGLEWRRGQSSYRLILRDEFLQDFNQAVNSVTIPQLKTNLQRLYLERW